MATLQHRVSNQSLVRLESPKSNRARKEVKTGVAAPGCLCICVSDAALRPVKLAVHCRCKWVGSSRASCATFSPNKS